MEYQNPPKRTRASALPSPGLNFTQEFSRNYSNNSRRLAVSIEADEQPFGLRVFPDVGSEVPSIYLTLPKDVAFRVRPVVGDPQEIKIAVNIHRLMKQLSWEEEPFCYDYIERKGDGFRVVQDEHNQIVTSMVPSEQNTLRITQIDGVNPKNLELVEEISALRLLLDIKTCAGINGLNGKVYKR